MTWRKFLVLPRVALAGLRPAPPPDRAWEDYWHDVRRTGPEGEVLWDGAGSQELEWWQATTREHLDRSLPLIDVGCGNGRLSRLLTGDFPKVVGVDVSSAAVELAAREAGDDPRLSFRRLDITDGEAAVALAAEVGAANVVVRGVFHVMDRGQRRRAAANIGTILDGRGTVVLGETAFPGDSLAYLEFLGASNGRLPQPVARLIDRRLPRPAYIGADELAESFPPAQWGTVASGPLSIEPVRLPGGPARRTIPGFYAVLRQRPAGVTGRDPA